MDFFVSFPKSPLYRRLWASVRQLEYIYPHANPRGNYNAGRKSCLIAQGIPWGGTTDFEGQLQELFDEVKTMIKMGNENDAIDLLQANYEAVKEQMDAGARGIKQAATLDVIALGVHCYWEFEDARLAPCWTWTIVSAKWFCWLTQYKLLWFLLEPF